jgi:hemerythrin-like domain-containing protein
MDPLITVSQVHNKIYEMSNMYEKILQGVNPFDVGEYIKGLNQLFRNFIVPHFEFEKNEIFPVALAKKEVGLESIISILLQEHKKIIEQLASLNVANVNIVNNPNSTQEERGHLLASCTALTRELTNHAQKEDSLFYPFFKDIIFKMK